MKRILCRQARAQHLEAPLRTKPFAEKEAARLFAPRPFWSPESLWPFRLHAGPAGDAGPLQRGASRQTVASRILMRPRPLFTALQRNVFPTFSGSAMCSETSS